MMHSGYWPPLGKDHPEEIVPILIELLDYKRRETRLNAVKALGAIGDESAIPILVEVVNSGSAKREKDREDAEIRGLAVEALGKIGGSAVEKLVEIVQNKGSSMRVDAIQALEQLGDERAVKPLLEVLSEQGQPRGRCKLLIQALNFSTRTVGRNGPPDCRFDL